MFLDVARGRLPSPCTGEDALEALLVAEACERSRRLGTSVTLEEVRAELLPDAATPAAAPTTAPAAPEATR